MEKTHSWNSGYIGKLTLDQTWLTQQSLDWLLNITFCQNVTEFKVWSGDIVFPTTTNQSVFNIKEVLVQNTCWNNILYPCQNLTLTFMVR